MGSDNYSILYSLSHYFRDNSIYLRIYQYEYIYAPFLLSNFILAPSLNAVVQFRTTLNLVNEDVGLRWGRRALINNELIDILFHVAKLNRKKHWLLPNRYSTRFNDQTSRKLNVYWSIHKIVLVSAACISVLEGIIIPWFS